MNRNIFSAWYCLAVLGLCLLAYFCLLPFIGPMRSQGAFGFMGLLGLLPFFWFVVFRKELTDERDKAFMQRSLLIGMSNGFGTVFAINGVLVARFAFLGIKSVPLNLVGIPTLCGLCITLLVSSVVLLLFYYKGENADKENGF